MCRPGLKDTQPSPVPGTQRPASHPARRATRPAPLPLTPRSPAPRRTAPHRQGRTASSRRALPGSVEACPAAPKGAARVSQAQGSWRSPFTGSGVEADEDDESSAALGQREGPQRRRARCAAAEQRYPPRKPAAPSSERAAGAAGHRAWGGFFCWRLLCFKRSKRWQKLCSQRRLLWHDGRLFSLQRKEPPCELLQLGLKDLPGLTSTERQAALPWEALPTRHGQGLLETKWVGPREAEPGDKLEMKVIKIP